MNDPATKTSNEWLGIKDAAPAGISPVTLPPGPGCAAGAGLVTSTG
jgi:hypothetical protein